MQPELSTYTLKDGDPNQEVKRLDFLHDCITRYFHGNLSLAPLEATAVLPTKVLELGSGSGAWAVAAARQFPGAQITAVDLVELPSRDLPMNINFQRLDLTGPLPFENSSYDIIHARLVFMHLRHATTILKRVSELLKPGGWLLVEDPDDEFMLDGGHPLGPNMKAFMNAWHESMREKGAEPFMGRYLQEAISSSGRFEIFTHRVDIPLSQQSSDAHENDLGLGWNLVMKTVVEKIWRSLSIYGVTESVATGFIEEMDDPNRKLTTRMYFVSARKL